MDTTAKPGFGQALGRLWAGFGVIRSHTGHACSAAADMAVCRPVWRTLTHTLQRCCRYGCLSACLGNTHTHPAALLPIWLSVGLSGEHSHTPCSAAADMAVCRPVWGTLTHTLQRCCRYGCLSACLGNTHTHPAALLPIWLSVGLSGEHSHTPCSAAADMAVCRPVWGTLTHTLQRCCRYGCLSACLGNTHTHPAALLPIWLSVGLSGEHSHTPCSAAADMAVCRPVWRTLTHTLQRCCQYGCLSACLGNTHTHPAALLPIWLSVGLSGEHSHTPCSAAADMAVCRPVWGTLTHTLQRCCRYGCLSACLENTHTHLAALLPIWLSVGLSGEHSHTPCSAAADMAVCRPVWRTLTHTLQRCCRYGCLSACLENTHTHPDIRIGTDTEMSIDGHEYKQASRQANTRPHTFTHTCTIIIHNSRVSDQNGVSLQ